MRACQFLSAIVLILIPFGVGQGKGIQSRTHKLLHQKTTQNDEGSKPIDPRELLALIEKADRIVLTWYGSGDGPWSGYPAYEGIAEDLPLDFSTPEIVSTIQSSNLTESQVEGAARLFGGWKFSHLRPDDLKEVPSELKAILLEHSLKSKDQDKRDRAQHAFKKR
jgi:hypothetical protein